ncbi:Intraflagellar transport protein 46 [Desmophyllum pertusum]|uniref:Intraflagellar transport protein 46 homolog n=1 Tax=Desmophyllum pertusum TaxID=174260 RepID=A0A9X0A3P1_9CNID|nr:Intraflagellar transport protein 46 [Desmophyllum pertusum]
MADSDDERRKLVVNQPYDETLEVNDDEEVASTFSPSPRPAVGKPGGYNPGIGSISMTDQSDDEFDHDNLVERKEAPGGYARSPGALQGIKERPGRPTGQEMPSQQNDDDDDDEGDEQSDSSEEDDDDEDAHGTALEGAYDPADYEHLPVSQEIKELFQYITRYVQTCTMLGITPQSIDLEHKMKPFNPDFIPAVGDIDAFLKVTRPDGKPETLGLVVLDEPMAKTIRPYSSGSAA